MTARDTRCLGCHAEAQAASKAEAAFIGYFTGKLPYEGAFPGIEETYEIDAACPEHRPIVDAMIGAVRPFKAAP